MNFAIRNAARCAALVVLVVGIASCAAREKQGSETVPDGSFLYSRVVSETGEFGPVTEQWVGSAGAWRILMEHPGDGEDGPPVIVMNGTAKQRGGTRSGWHVFTTVDQVRALPSSATGALTQLRRSVRNTDDPSSADGRFESNNSTDAYVVKLATDLLWSAPLSERQRDALTDLITTSPEWFDAPTGSNTSVTKTTYKQRGLRIPAIKITNISTEVLDAASDIAERYQQVTWVLLDSKTNEPTEYRSSRGRIAYKSSGTWVTDNEQPSERFERLDSRKIVRTRTSTISYCVASPNKCTRTSQLP